MPKVGAEGGAQALGEGGQQAPDLARAVAEGAEAAQVRAVQAVLGGAVEQDVGGGRPGRVAAGGRRAAWLPGGGAARGGVGWLLCVGALCHVHVLDIARVLIKMAGH